MQTCLWAIAIIARLNHFAATLLPGDINGKHCVPMHGITWRSSVSVFKHLTPNEQARLSILKSTARQSYCLSPWECDAEWKAHTTDPFSASALATLCRDRGATLCALQPPWSCFPRPLHVQFSTLHIIGTCDASRLRNKIQNGHLLSVLQSS